MQECGAFGKVKMVTVGQGSAGSKTRAFQTGRPDHDCMALDVSSYGGNENRQPAG